MKTHPQSFTTERGSTLVVTIAVVATILVLLGSAVGYTQHISRMASRNRKSALAMEIADGHLEYLFSSWRNISRAPALRYTLKQPPTNFFFTTPDYNPGPAPTPWTSPSPGPSPWPGAPAPIPRPSPSNFSTESGYTVDQYRIQAVTPMIELDASEKSILATNAFPPAAFGPNTWQYSFFYLASVDISVPTLKGTVKAKVRRVFEKKYDNPWAFAVFYNDDLELQPVTPLSIDGPVHTNGSLYIGTSNLTVANGTTSVRPPSKVSYGASYVNGFGPGDVRYRADGIYPAGTVSAPTFPIDLPPSQESPYLPFGWNLKMQNADGSVNNDSYHELVERIATGSTDPLQEVRYYNQAGYRVVINADNSVKIIKADGTELQGNPYGNWVGNNGQGSSTSILDPGKAVYDARENAWVRVVNVDVAKLTSFVNSGALPGWNGVVYITDAGAATYNPDRTVKTAGTSSTLTVNGTPYPTTKRAVRLINGAALPEPSNTQSGYVINPYTGTTYKGLTIASDNPVYIQGNYNTGYNPPSNTGTYTSPTGTLNANGSGGTYARKPAAVIADAVTVLSNAWLDGNSPTSPTRTASNTTVNTAIVAGTVPSSSNLYGGGGENFIRLLENWAAGTNSSFTYYGSLVQLYQSNQAIGRWSGTGSICQPPDIMRFYYDTNFAITSPPGNLQIAAYLQQQRWYQVY